MNILHYSLGLFPNRQGGLVRYSTDLAIMQSKTENVFYLMPGKLGIVDKRVKIVKGNNHKSLHIYKIENALPIPLFAGIKDIAMYTKKVDSAVYERFIMDNNVDVIHIHTLMGLHIEFLRAAKDIGVPIFMTTHDFFGICPITTLYKNGDVCKSNCICDDCFECSQSAHSYLKLAVGQSEVYKKLKKSSIVSKMRKNALADTSESRTRVSVSDTDIPNYKKLDKYYKDCFALIDYFLFNSNQTKVVYEAHLGALPGEVIPLLLPTIKDKRKNRDFLKNGTLHIGYMGECKEFKGYFLLRDAVEELSQDGYKVELDVYNDSAVESKSVVRRGSYSAKELDGIYDSVDIVAVPSIWYETLSFIAIEAIAGGMPCMVSDHVGAKDSIIDGETGFVIKAGDKETLKKCLKNTCEDKGTLSSVNQNICQSDIGFDFKDHSKTIISKYSMKGYKCLRT